MTVQAISLSKTLVYSTLCLGICIGWADLETFASEIELKRTGRAGNVDESGADEDSLRPSGRIIGGVESVPNSHPYMVRLIVTENNDRIGCSGVILSEEWILTSANCIQNAVSAIVKAGRHDMSAKEYHGQEVNGKQFIYDLFDKKYKKDDIGFIKVSPKLELNAYVKVATLADPGWAKSGWAKVAGWGHTSTVKNATVNTVLHEVDTGIMSNVQCAALYPKDIIFQTNICAGDYKGGRDACTGDSGGPLWVVEAGVELVVGIVSWGTPCALPLKPTVYTRLSLYRNYIKKMTGYDKNTRTSLSSAIGKSLCEQYDLFLDEHRLTPPVKERSRKDNKCAWFDWKGNCDSQSCNPFSVANC